MGGRVGLKGTDNVVDRAIELGARPTAHLKAREALGALRRLLEGLATSPKVHLVTCSGRMGADSLELTGFNDIQIVYEVTGETAADDTKSAVGRFLKTGVELILFCGGDGTGRDICSVVGQTVPMLGIPAGVKMYSGVFGVNPARTAEILIGYLEGNLTLTRVDVLDLDEERYRRGEWAVRLYHSALTPYEPTFTQSAKMLISESTDVEVKEEIASYLHEEIAASPDVLYLLGPGSTVQSVGDGLGIDKTLLGVDAVADRKVVGKDLNEREIMALLERFPNRKLVLSPIGAQGFVLGRGNLQLSPKVVKAIGAKNITVIATPAKLARTPVLRVDTGDDALDRELIGRGYIPVVIGRHRKRLVKAAI
jgi:predicted polyphosphate/ATP-dependent NAD kinase